MDFLKMTIRFKCPHCQKPLSVKDHLAGKKAACPVCKKQIIIPAAVTAPPPGDVESLAAEALADKPAEKPPEAVSGKPIEFICPFCDEELTLPADLGGKKTPCPKCTNIIKVPLPQETKPKDWRTTQRGGPSAALANLPEQLSDAWGTEQKGRVSREAMEEAGAIPEPEATPVGVGGWIRRGIWTCVIGGALFFVVSLAMRMRSDKLEKDHLEEAKNALPKMDKLLQAEIHRIFGEIDVRNGKVDDAQVHFNTARSLLSIREPARADPEKSLEAYRSLRMLVLAQADMGGSGDETLRSGMTSERFDWKDEIVQKDMRQTLEEIHAPEAQAAALRDLSCKLLDKNHFEIAISLATQLTSTHAAIRAQGVALLLFRNSDAASNDFAPPDGSKSITEAVRLAYTEGHAFKREYAEALKIASAKGPALGRLEACVAGAAIVLADKKDKDAAKVALTFIRQGLEAYKELEKEAKEGPPPWAVMELICLGSRTEAAEEVKSIVGQLPAAFRPRAQLDIFEGYLDRNPTKVAEHARVEAVGDARRALAWEALARHNARLGYGGTVNAVIADVDEAYRPFLHLGIALGEQDRKK